MLRAAAGKHPEHFRLAANLATAWQLAGDPAAAARALEEAVRLAPKEAKSVEELHLKLVKGRAGEGKNPAGWDDLFGVKYDGDAKKLPADAVALLQRLGLALPADGRLLWQLGELANARGDVRTAAGILEGCVSEFGLGSPELRTRRARYREEAARIAKLSDEDHAKYRGDIDFKSPRPLPRKLDAAALPDIRPDGVNDVPWPVVTETSVGRGFKPAFAKHLRNLDGKRVALTGYMRPVGDDPEVTGFLLLEYPVGCWFCETPEPTAIVYVSLAAGKAVGVKRDLVKIAGTLKLNATDPEDFLYTISDATVAEPD